MPIQSLIFGCHRSCRRQTVDSPTHRSRPPIHACIIHTLQIMLLASALLATGCSQRPQRAASDQVPDIVHTIEEHGIAVTLTLSPGIMDPREDALLTVKTRFPNGLPVDFPSTEAALQGFTVAATLSPPETRDAAGYRVRETILRLSPIPGSNYRIAPMLFAVQPNQDDPDDMQYLITPAIRPPARRMTADQDAALAQTPQSAYIPPTIAEVMRWIGIAILLLLIAVALVLLARKLKRKIEIIRMSPVERARYDLERLLAKDLPSKGEFKTFYFEITGIIRTYIERQHSIRAPELTTPEFLAAVAKRPEFPPAVVERLQEFLESADLVKFAAWTPTKRAITDSIETARSYLDEDEHNRTEGKS